MAGLELTTSRQQLSAVLDDRSKLDVPSGDKRIALVPTMGALHAGHAALLDEARRRADIVVASIFVNPTQFGATEDFSSYPRPRDDDLAVCSAHGVDVVFAPDASEIYLEAEPAVTVQPGWLGDILEGAARPGHFIGVLTVVAKLLNLVQPDVSLFGEKDYQQLVLIQRMAHALFLPGTVVAAPTVRAADGLAVSSRNRYLTGAQRTSALALSRALLAGQAAGASGAAAVLAAAARVLRSEPALDVDYLALRSTDLTRDLRDTGDPGSSASMGAAPSRAARLLVAARIGSTRLIDNAPVELGTM